MQILLNPDKHNVCFKNVLGIIFENSFVERPKLFIGKCIQLVKYLKNENFLPNPPELVRF
jgi:hypothetical protein